MAKLERIYTIPLGDAFRKPRNQRAPRAVKLLREFAAKHMKADGRVVVSEMLNMFIWERSIQKPPRHVKVRLIKDEGEVRAYLADEKIEEPKKEEKKEEKKPEAKKEEPKKPTEKKAEPKKEEKPKAEEKKAPEKAPEKKEAAPKKEAPKKEEAKDKK
jgi:large subunit ribosomal protein L31e